MKSRETYVLSIYDFLDSLPCLCFTPVTKFFYTYFTQVYDMMLRDERYYPSFNQSPLYVRMLAELDMLKEPSYRGSDDGDGESFNGSPTGSINLVCLLHFLLQGSESNPFQLNNTMKIQQCIENKTINTTQ